MDGWFAIYVLFNNVSSYQDDDRLIMKSSFYGWEDFASGGDRTRSARSVGQRLTHWATGAPA